MVPPRADGASGGSTEYQVDFPTLWVALDWVEAHCVIPDGFSKGQPYVLANWQAWAFANHYRIKPNAPLPTNQRPAVGAPAFFYRRSQVVMPQKAGKGPMTAAQCCLEGLGPALFCGWAHGGEVYDCRDHGCGCGWMYEYSPGEPMGTHWNTPLIQITAYSEEQTFNIFGALKPMMQDGPLANAAVRIGEEFIRLPGDGKIDTVTSSQMSRLGQRVTYVPQDEVGLWTKENKMLAVATTQRRGAAGMQGRVTETTNGWDPSENSVAQRTAHAALTSPDIFRLHRLAPSNLRFTNQRDRRRILRYVYEGCWWIDLDGIEAEALEILKDDPANAMRFFGNMIVVGQGAWMPDGLWDATADAARVVPPGTPVAGGFDGSDSDDWTALRLETQDGFRFTPTYGPDNRPCYWNPAEWGGSIPRGEVHAAMDEVFRKYRVKRLNCDTKEWQSEIGEWAVKWGDTVVFEWPCYRIIPTHNALVRSLTDLKTAQKQGRKVHDGCVMAADHVANARKAAKPQDRYLLAKPDAHRKIDIAMADTLAHEAAAELHELKAWGLTPHRRAVGAAHVG